ncbi:2-C-methyl-D-erythritol 2,4-cyclodiphosphate synthase [Tissierella creatinophila]|uniref:2-C-methyl-D-erythritol 2,4-cyclodiphosphate synthase n=1 Tax=Tissierella creatinophila DSM 6911 TaxID=1123403 RepID=A0A1U7M4Q0_TISCR|nr:2-C-methyl-D-erythritol 2,4-cyclodiphosphate synthase [Tissierella creatinophila]OLS02168.1 2-C-methyl-D-erythritol 2,4-cyclodiphosphate synthase [Tissierella creatinophila DSM 6911]
MRIGFGFDVHELVDKRNLIIGGVDIPHEKGLLGHSDADVLIHAIMDSILGAMALGDIGYHFPDTDQQYKDISSLILLEKVKDTMDSNGFKIGNIDATVAAQSPKLAPFILEMRKNISRVLECSLGDINIKATTTEKLGFVGRKEGISSYSVCMLKAVNS